MTVQEMYDNRHNYKKFGGDAMYYIFEQFYLGRKEFDWDAAFANEHRFTTYCVDTWICTDTMVGLFMYTLDDMFIGYSCQSARKSDIWYYFNENTLCSLEQFLLSLARPEVYLHQMARLTKMDDTVKKVRT